MTGFLRRLYRPCWKLKGFEVEAVRDRENGADYAETGIYDLLILDVTMPSLNGYQVAKQARTLRVTTPILMPTAKGEVQDRIEGPNAGADHSCIAALLRKQGGQMDVLRYGNTSLDLSDCTLSGDKGSIRLSQKEFDILSSRRQRGLLGVRRASACCLAVFWRKRRPDSILSICCAAIDPFFERKKE